MAKYYCFLRKQPNHNHCTAFSVFHEGVSLVVK